MKKYVLTLPLCALLAATGCHKSKNTSPSETFSATPAMTGTKDGKDWTAAYALYGSVISSEKPVQFSLVGMAQANADIIYIRILDYKGGTGTYDLDPAANQGWAYDAAQTGAEPKEYAKSGSISIVHVLPDSTVQGTYEFTTNANSTLKGKFTFKPQYY